MAQEDGNEPLLWPGSWPGKAAEMLRRDLDAAGLSVEDAAGHVLDFHSRRHTFGTNLAKAGVAPKMAQELMRHSDINLTMGTYSHVGLYDLDEAVQLLPEIPTIDPVDFATGTANAEQGGENSWHQNWHRPADIQSDSVAKPTPRATSKSSQNNDLEADCGPLIVNETRATDETRSHDLRFTKASLCQLSYGGIVVRNLALRM